MSEKTILALVGDRSPEVVLRDMFDEHGFVINIVRTRPEFEMALGAPIDIIYLEINVPDFDGIEAIEALSQAKLVGQGIIINGPDAVMCQMVSRYAKMRGFPIMAILTPSEHPHILKDILTQWRASIIQEPSEFPAT